MDQVDLGLTLFGTGLAIWAMVQAGGAKRAVASIIAKNIDQVARDKARDLLGALTVARDAAMARKRGASRLASAGRSASADLQALQLAQDALATSTLGAGQALATDLQRAAIQIDLALRGLAGNCARDDWADALGVLQGVIPKIDALQAELTAKVLR